MSGHGGRAGSGRAARVLGGAVSLIAIAWVLWALLRPDAPGGLAGATGLGSAVWTGVLIGVPIYAGLLALLAAAWWWLSDVYDRRPSLGVGYRIWSRTQIAKYLPGNVFHYVGRHALGRSHGLSHETLLAANALELGSTLLAAALLALYGWGVSRAGLPAGLAAGAGALLTGLGLLGWLAADRIFRRLPGLEGLAARLPRLSAPRLLRLSAPSLLLALGFFVGTGALAAWLYLRGSPEASAAPLDIIWLYPGAWLLGTLTPGAPAGLGVREAALTLQLAPLLGQPPAAALALALRLVTTGGDLLTAALGWGAEAAS